MNLIEPALQWQPEFQAIRRDLHAHPELKFQEVRTADVDHRLPIERKAEA